MAFGSDKPGPGVRDAWAGFDVAAGEDLPRIERIKEVQRRFGDNVEKTAITPITTEEAAS